LTFNAKVDKFLFYRIVTRLILISSGKDTQSEAFNDLSVRHSGIVGAGLTPEVITAYAAAFGSYCDGGKIIIGRDSRTTGEIVRHAALAGLLSVGCDVVDLGIVPTPTIQLTVERTDAAGGIAFTASHNPRRWWNRLYRIPQSSRMECPEILLIGRPLPGRSSEQRAKSHQR